jgi:hypothetical protein
VWIRKCRFSFDRSEKLCSPPTPGQHTSLLALITSSYTFSPVHVHQLPAPQLRTAHSLLRQTHGYAQLTWMHSRPPHLSLSYMARMHPLAPHISIHIKSRPLWTITLTPPDRFVNTPTTRNPSTQHSPHRPWLAQRHATPPT